MRKQTLLRRTAWCALFGYVLVASGLPLPFGSLPGAGGEAAAKRLAVKDRSQPFPCMDKPCGCTTAEQCFTNCCCRTPAERLAWAKAHSVEPAVLVALDRRIAANAAPTKPSGGCCAAKAAKKPTCCSAGADEEKQAAPPAPPAPPRLRTVTLQAMLACGGIVSQWLTVGVSLPPPRVEFALPWPFVEICICGDHAADGISAAPALPPPRAA